MIRLTDEELETRGVQALGARRKLLKVFQLVKTELDKESIPYWVSIESNIFTRFRLFSLNHKPPPAAKPYVIELFTTVCTTIFKSWRLLSFILILESVCLKFFHSFQSSTRFSTNSNVNTDKLGGAERLIVDAAVGLQLKGHQIDVYTSHHDVQHCFEETRNGMSKISWK